MSSYNSRIGYLFGSVFLAVFIYSCNSDETAITDSKDSIITNSDINKEVELDSVKIETIPDVKYTLLILDDSIRKQLGSQFEEEQLKTIAALNRIDPDRLIRLDSLVIPDTFYVDLNKYSPFPLSLSQADSIHKLILISYRLQAFAVYDTGVLVRWGPVSMGKKTTQTPKGLFHTNWKSKSQISTDNSDWILPWYFNLINSTGVSLHEFELPGYPASHSCIRLRSEDAQWFYDYADQWKLDKKGWNILVQGTPVIIFGEYPFGQPKPWYSLINDAKSNLISADSLNSEIIPFYKKIILEQNKRILQNADTSKKTV